MNVKPKSILRLQRKRGLTAQQGLSHFRGFTLVELLVALIVLAVLAAIVLPKFIGSSNRARESRMNADLRLIRAAIERFYVDTGAYPAELSDLAATSAPARGLDSAGDEVVINPLEWHGPYLDRIPENPVSGDDYPYTDALPGIVGTVSSGVSTSTTPVDGT